MVPAPRSRNNEQDPTTTLVLTFRRGKVVRTRGPYSVHTSLPSVWAAPILARLRSLQPSAQIFQGSPMDTVSAGTAALKAISPSLEARSLRRGSLQTLASNGAHYDELMKFSGHTSVDTLLRYLGWGATIGPKEARLAGLAKALAPTH